jgi:hypothetical protein
MPLHHLFIPDIAGLRTRGRIEVDDGGSVDDILDRNLEEMSAGLSRLKHLATGLNNELVSMLLNILLRRRRSRQNKLHRLSLVSFFRTSLIFVSTSIIGGTPLKCFTLGLTLKY